MEMKGTETHKDRRGTETPQGTKTHGDKGDQNPWRQKGTETHENRGD